jgi:predicted HicB family RNase H-like nuclease
MAKQLYDTPQIRVNLMLTPALHEAVRARAVKEGVSMSQVVRDALLKHLEVKDVAPDYEADGA